MEIPIGIFKPELDLCREINAEDIIWEVINIKKG